MEDVLICDFIRTPIGRYAGALSAVRADDLAALPIKYLKDKHPNLPWNTVDEVFWDVPTKQVKTTVTLHVWQHSWQAYLIQCQP